MKLLNSVQIAGLNPVMRQVLRAAEIEWKVAGHPEGVTVTAALDGEHSATSWHYYGLALDFRTNYLNKGLEGPDIDVKDMWHALRRRLPDFDIVIHSTHIHVEIGNVLAKKLKLLY